MLGYQLDSMILRVLSNRNDSVILCISNSQLLGTSLNTGLLQKKERSESCSSVLKDHSGKLFLKERVTRPALQDQGDHEASRATAEPSPPPATSASPHVAALWASLSQYFGVLQPTRCLHCHLLSPTKWQDGPHSIHNFYNIGMHVKKKKQKKKPSIAFCKTFYFSGT